MKIYRSRQQSILYPMVINLLVVLTALSRGAHAQANLTDRLAGQRLSGDFALHYRVSIFHNNSPQIVKEKEEAVIRAADKAVQAGSISRAEVEKGMAQLKADDSKQAPPRHYDMILTGHKGMLRMETQDTDIPMIVIYSGKQTFTFFPKSNNAFVDNRLQFQKFIDLPIPGVGFSDLPLIKLPVKGVTGSNFRGDVYTGMAMSQEGEPMYLPGTVDVQSGPASTLRVVTLSSDSNGHPYQRWDFQGTKMVHAQPVATFIRKVQFDLSNPEKTFAKKPDVGITTEYTLVDADEKPVSNDLFDPYTLVRGANSKDPYDTGTTVQWNGEPRVVAFSYVPGKTLKEQRDAQLEVVKGGEQEREQARHGQSGWTGPILIGVFVAFGGYWLIRRKRLSIA